MHKLPLIKDENIGIFWDVKTETFLLENEGPVMECQYGWTAGMTEEQIKESDDGINPVGHNTFHLNLQSAKNLKDKLEIFIQESEKVQESDYMNPEFKKKMDDYAKWFSENYDTIINVVKNEQNNNTI